MGKPKMTPTGHRGIYQVPGGFLLRPRVTDPRTGKEVERARTIKGVGLKTAKAEFAHLRQEMQEELRRGGLQKESRETVSDYALSWYERGLPNWAQSTRERYLVALEQHILPSLGSIPLRDVRRGDVEDWRVEMTRKVNPKNGKAYDNTTINGWLRVLIHMLKDAVAGGLTEQDPTLRIKALPEVSGSLDPSGSQEDGAYDADRKSLSWKEMDVFLAKMKELYPQFYPLVKFGMASGLRWGELSALMWGDKLSLVGEGGREVHFISVVRSQYKGELKGPKTPKSVRTIPLIPLAMAALEEQKETLVRTGRPVGPKDWIFPSTRGTCRRGSILTKPIRKVLEKMGLDRRFTPHGMRHTFNDLVRRTAQDGVLVRNMTGHTDARMTDKYSFPDLLEKNAAVHRAFEQPKPNPGDSRPEKESSGVREPQEETGDQTGYRQKAA
jgi:integrase